MISTSRSKFIAHLCQFQLQAVAALGRQVQLVFQLIAGIFRAEVSQALLLPRFFGLDGVLCSMPVSDILTFLIAAVIIVRTYRELAPLKMTRK